VKWPLRFEFDIDFILPENMWKDKKISISGKSGFRQPLILKKWEEIKPIIQALNPNVEIELLRKTSEPVTPTIEDKVSPTHDNIKKLLLEIGKLQAFIADVEYPMGSERLDVVWRRLPESVPTYVFEVQVGGDPYHALAKLKHAFDLWNSHIFIVAPQAHYDKVENLLSGTFHEIGNKARFIELKKLDELHRRKKAYLDLEKELGIISME